MAGLLEVGDAYGHYRIERLIGRGGMGAVYEATDLRLNRLVALKIVLPTLSDTEDFQQRFEREASVLARIRSRHIVQIYEYGEHEGMVFLVTEYLPDGDLHTWLERHGSLMPPDALTIGIQLCDALADAHVAGVIHRDVKPSNVLLWARPNGLIPYLCDFGIALDGDSGFTRTGALIGSPAYMAPERHLGRPATERGDLYSLGCVLWACMTGHPPYSGTEYQLMHAHLNEPIPELPETESPGLLLNQLFARLLAKDPLERPASAVALRSELAAMLVETPVTVVELEPESPPEPTPSPLSEAPTLMKASPPPADPDPAPTMLAQRAALPSLDEHPQTRSARWKVIVAAAASAAVLLTVTMVVALTRSDGTPGPSTGDAPETRATSQAPASAIAPTPTPATSPGPTGSVLELTDAKCAASATSADSFKVGGILPLTGNLAFLGPPAVSGLGLAVNEINGAGGVNGAQACSEVLDSGDSTDLSISTRSAGTLVAGKPSVVIGAVSSTVSLNVVDIFADNKITEVSPSNTATDLSRYSPFYFRTAPPDRIQGNALGKLISRDGYTRVGFLVFNDTYGTGVRNAVQDTIERTGGKCVYGCKGEGAEFPANQTTFSAEVQAVTAAKPNAIVVLAFDETKSIVPELAASGFDMSKTYYSDGNTSDYTEDFEPGTLEGAQGTIPGADPVQGFKDSLVAWYKAAQGDDLAAFANGAESYDATILAALAAAKGGANDSQTVQKNFAAVSGATQGKACASYADCLALIKAGSEIRYKGPSGIGPIDNENDPSSASVGIYQYDAYNSRTLSGTIKGSKQ